MSANNGTTQQDDLAEGPDCSQETLKAIAVANGHLTERKHPKQTDVELAAIALCVAALKDMPDDLSRMQFVWEATAGFCAICGAKTDTGQACSNCWPDE